MRLVIPQEVEAKLHAYVMAVPGEIAGMGKVRIEDNGDIVVEDVVIYDQEVTGGTADLSTEALASFMMEKIQAGESLSPWILWWHSHSDMQAFFSGRDTSTIDQSTDFTHLISLVVNKRRERECRVDTYRPFRLTMEDIDIVVPTNDFVIPADIQAEVDQKVKQKTYSWEGRNQAGFGHNHDHSHGGPKKVGSLLAPIQDTLGSRFGGTGNEGESDDGEPTITDIANGMSSDAIREIIAGIRYRIQELVNYGKEETDEYYQMESDLVEWTELHGERMQEEIDEALDNGYNPK